MSAPKSVVKFTKNFVRNDSLVKASTSVKYVSNVDFCQYTIKELSRAALRDVGKFVRIKFRENFYKQFKKHSGYAGKVTKCKVYASANTIKPRLEVGLPVGAQPGFYAYFQEVGSSKQPKYGILQKTVNSNVATIIEIESQYLSALRDEAEALKLIDSEQDYEVSEDE